jgi:hypothetical protein
MILTIISLEVCRRTVNAFHIFISSIGTAVWIALEFVEHPRPLTVNGHMCVVPIQAIEVYGGNVAPSSNTELYHV